MADARDLYGLPLDQFVTERAALAKALRADGQAERAAQVAKLRRPSVAAWAVNQLVRTQRRAVSELLESGDELRRAQSELLAGRGDPRTLRAAADRERAAVKDLTDTARGLLSSEGHALSATMLDRVRETLHATALDEDARDKVTGGCLEHELRHVGIGDSGAPAGAAKVQAASLDTQARRERSEQLNVARKAAADARRAAERAERNLAAAEARRDRAAAALAAAEAAVTDARQRGERAALEHKRTLRALTERRD